MSGKRATTGADMLPLGAVRGDDGSVVVPESRRADGSVRKPIRIRQGYVPQDEVPKYKPIGQRLREQQAKQQQATKREDDSSADAVADALDALSLSKPVTPSPGTVKRDRPAQSPPQRRPLATSAPQSPKQLAAALSTKELKTELSGVNKALREITKLEAFAAAYARGNDGSRPLTAPQRRKVDRKAELETRRHELIRALDERGKETEEEAKPKTLRVIEIIYVTCFWTFANLRTSYEAADSKGYCITIRAKVKAVNPDKKVVEKETRGAYYHMHILLGRSN